MSLKAGYRISPVYGKEQEQQVTDFRGNAVGTIRLQPHGWFFTTPFIDFADKIFDFEFKPSDVLVMTYPKCGTTWTQEIIWTLLCNPDLSHPMAGLPVNVRCPFLEMDFILRATNSPPLEPGNEIYDAFAQHHPDKDPNEGIFLQMAQGMAQPRTFKTHLPLSFFKPDLLDTCKVIYVARDPKDVAVSYYHHSRIFKCHGFTGSLDSFVDHFINDTLLYSPYWKNVKEAWTSRGHPNLHFLYYEDLKADPKAEITRLQDFLGTNLSGDQIDKVVEYTSFPAMKSRDTVVANPDKTESAENGFMDTKVVKEDGGFFRKGISGDWKNKLTEEQVVKIEEWTKKNVAKDFGPEFKYGK